MSLPSPKEFADSLTLKPGMDVGPSPVLKDDQLDSHLAVAGRLASNHTAGKNLSPFWHEVGSLYLPSLLRTYFLNFYDYQDSSSNSTFWMLTCAPLWSHLCRGMDLVPSFNRFARARPAEVVSFFHIQAERLVDLSKNQAAWTEFFHLFLDLASEIMSHFTKTISSTSLLHHLRDSAGPSTPALLRRLQALRSRVGPDRDSVRRFDSVLLHLEISLQPPNDPYKEAKALFVYEPATGFACELFAKTHNVEDPFAQGCVKPAEGMEMHDCSRCHCVRYCSVAHQKADWKTHKALCFPPGW